MAYNYVVAYSTSSTGPWTAAGTVTTTTDTISGLLSSTNYYVQITVQDTTTGLLSTPVVAGPFLTSTGEAAPGTLINTTSGTQSAVLLASNTPGTAGSQNSIYITTGGTINVTNGGVSAVIGGQAVISLYNNWNHTVYQMNSSGNWYGPVVATVAAFGNEIQLGGSPIPTTTGITLNSASVASGAPANTVVGALAVTGGAWTTSGATPTTSTNAYVFGGTFSLSGTNASSFKIVGSNIETAAALANGNYSVTPVASSFTFNGVSVPAFTGTPITIAVGQSVTLIQVPVAASLGTDIGGGGGDSAGVEGKMATHWTDFVSQIGGGRALYAITAVGVNAWNYYAEGTNWAGGADNPNWNSSNFPSAAVVTSTFPILTWPFTDGSSTNQDYTAFINNQWPGQAVGSVASSITGCLNSWKAIGLKKIYIRPNWEFNTIGGPDNGESNYAVTPANAANFVAAWKFFANTAHTWGNSNGVTVRMVWGPDTSFTSTITSTGNVINYFPQPDSNAVNGRYVDVIGPDWYMGGYSQGLGPTGGTSLNAGYTTALSSNSNWSFGTFVKMCQTYNCNFGSCETGDVYHPVSPAFADQGNSWSDGTMYSYATYLNTFATLSPPVPIEFISIFDVYSQNLQVTGGLNTNLAAGWRCMFGNNPTQPSPNYVIPPIMTIAPI